MGQRNRIPMGLGEDTAARLGPAADQLEVLGPGTLTIVSRWRAHDRPGGRKAAS